MTDIDPNAARFEALAPLSLEADADAFEIVARNRERFLVPVRQPLIVMPQIQRSGGTLMTQLLDGHPQLHVHHSELHIGKPKYIWPTINPAQDAGALFEQLREENARVHATRGYLKVSGAEEANNPNHRDFVLPFIFLERLQKRLFVELAAQRKPATQRDVLDHYATSYFNAWLDYAGLYRAPAQVKYWVAFAARLMLGRDSLTRFFADYPDGHLVVSVRDPVSWYASALGHNARYARLEESLAAWNRGYHNAIKAARSYPGQVHFVAFEALVSDPERTMRDLLARLGLAFDGAVLEPSYNGMPIVSDSSFGARFGLDQSATDRSSGIAPETAARIRAATDRIWRKVLGEIAGINAG